MDEDAVLQQLAGQVVLVTGACGSVGSAVAHLLAQAPLERLRLLDQHEEGMHRLAGELTSPHCRYLIGDVRSPERVRLASRGCDMVIHTAALKHVALGEYNPSEVVLTNLVGLNAVIQAALENRVRRTAYTSSDKAAHPTSVMGASKLLGERIIAAARDLQENSLFCCTRFGNVLGSSGSVVRTFLEQISRGGPVTVTHPEMTRFVMTLEQAARQIVGSCLAAEGGEVFVLKMPALRIDDLAEVMISKYAEYLGHRPESIERTYIGARVGEKLYEELMTTEEATRARELEHQFVIDSPADDWGVPPGHQLSPQPAPKTLSAAYVSSDATLLTSDQIADLLRESGIERTLYRYRNNDSAAPRKDSVGVLA
ncbi:MAG: polysaccharide biosynthesis protein [bacterium]|nr:polysaccharide biosynthesis protein [bacterium]